MFERIGLGTILKRYRLTVPPNQREYSWEDKHVKTLLHDLNKAMLDEDEEYFLGTIVGVEKTTELIEIVDGQQRLATIILFLCQIRNYLKDSDPIIAQDITTGHLTYIDRGRKEKVPRMRLNVADNEFFKSIIKSDGKALPPLKPSHDLTHGQRRLR